MSPIKSIRKFCIECAGSKGKVSKCGGNNLFRGMGDDNGQCWFYKYRAGRGRPSVKVIRKHCLECVGHSYKLVAECTSMNCPVHKFRLGTNPNHVRKPEAFFKKNPVRQEGFLPHSIDREQANTLVWSQ